MKSGQSKDDDVWIGGTRMSPGVATIVFVLWVLIIAAFLFAYCT